MKKYALIDQYNQSFFLISEGLCKHATTEADVSVREKDIKDKGTGYQMTTLVRLKNKCSEQEPPGGFGHEASKLVIIVTSTRSSMGPCGAHNTPLPSVECSHLAKG